MSSMNFESSTARALAISSALLCTPTLLFAQNPARQIPVKVRYSVAPQNTCLQIASMPSPLVGSPEGMVILRMQHELSNVAASMNARPANDDSRPGMRRVLMLRHGVDSLAREYAQSMDTAMRTVRGAPLRQDSVHLFLRGSDARGSFEGVRMSSVDASRDPIEMRIRELEPQVRDLARGQNSASVEMVLSRTSNAPGYLGITASSGALTSFVNGVEVVSYCDYPMVESIEPGSPADKAGILTGDTLLAYNGGDLRQHDVNYSRLLVPGKTVTIRYRRDGKAHDLPVVVGRRAAERVAGAPEPLPCDNDESRAACEARVTVSVQGFILPSGSPAPISRRPSPPFGPRPAGGPGGPPDARARAYGSMPLLVSTTEAGGRADFAGAKLTAIGAAFASNLGVEPGLLVMEVVPSSPAGESGLQQGDIISEANGVAVRDVNALRRVLSASPNERSASLQVSSKNSPTRTTQSGVRTVVVRW